VADHLQSGTNCCGGGAIFVHNTQRLWWPYTKAAIVTAAAEVEDESASLGSASGANTSAATGTAALGSGNLAAWLSSCIADTWRSSTDWNAADNTPVGYGNRLE
jgi:hypothetical protein